MATYQKNLQKMKKTADISFKTINNNKKTEN